MLVTSIMTITVAMAILSSAAGILISCLALMLEKAIKDAVKTEMKSYKKKSVRQLHDEGKLYKAKPETTSKGVGW